MCIVLVHLGEIRAQSELRFFEFDKQLQSYVPAVNISDKVSFFVNCKASSERILEVCLPHGGSILINNHLVQQVARHIDPDCVRYPIDSLYNIYEKDSIFITLYNLEGLADFKAKIIEDENGNDEELRLKARNHSNFRDFFILALCATMLILGIWKISLNVQSLGYINISSLFAIRIRDSSMYNTSFFQQDNLKFFGVLALVFSLVVMYLHQLLGNLIIVFWSGTVLGLMVSWILNAWFYFVLLYVKFLLVTLFSQVYNFRNFKYIQYYDFSRFLFVAIILLFLISLLDFISMGKIAQTSVSWLIYLPLLVLMIYIGLTYQKLNKLFSNKKLHLFFYLCATEIIPIILIVKISR